MKRLAFLVLTLVLSTGAAHAQLAKEDADDNGVLNPIDFSLRYYTEEMDRFPDRVGIVCGLAYELDKTGLHDQTLTFLQECAKRGNPPSMILIAELYDSGAGVPCSPETATMWVRRAAELDWSAAQYLYGVALIEGHGAPKDAAAGELWLQKAAAQGDRAAITRLAERAAVR